MDAWIGFGQLPNFQLIIGGRRGAAAITYAIQHEPPTPSGNHFFPAYDARLSHSIKFIVRCRQIHSNRLGSAVKRW